MFSWHMFQIYVAKLLFASEQLKPQSKTEIAQGVKGNGEECAPILERQQEEKKNRK